MAPTTARSGRVRLSLVHGWDALGQDEEGVDEDTVVRRQHENPCRSMYKLVGGEGGDRFLRPAIVAPASCWMHEQTRG